MTWYRCVSASGALLGYIEAESLETATRVARVVYGADLDAVIQVRRPVGWRREAPPRGR